MRSIALLLAVVACPAFAGGEHAPLVVVLDPGHGGAFPHDGAHGPRRGLIEKNIALAVAKKTRDAMEAAGLTVILTRESDVDVSLDRSGWSARVRATGTMTSDAHRFIVTSTLEAFEGHARVFARTYTHEFPRDGV